MSVDITLEVWSGPGAVAYAFSGNWYLGFLKIAREAGCDIESFAGKPATELGAALRTATSAIVADWTHFAELMAGAPMPLGWYLQEMAALAAEAERHAFAVVRVQR